jgi:hypothetical protein
MSDCWAQVRAFVQRWILESISFSIFRSRKVTVTCLALVSSSGLLCSMTLLFVVCCLLFVVCHSECEAVKINAFRLSGCGQFSMFARTHCKKEGLDQH